MNSIVPACVLLGQTFRHVAFVEPFCNVILYVWSGVSDQCSSSKAILCKVVHFIMFCFQEEQH